MTATSIPTDSFSLPGRVAVVTGAASGLGRETARILSRAGAKVMLADIDASGLEATAGLIGSDGGTALVQRTDVSSIADLDGLAEAARQAFGPIDVWVNSAGVTHWGGVLDAPPEAVQRLVSINMLGTYWGCVAAGRAMREAGRGGTIVNVSSTAGDSPVPGLSVYGMTKAAVNQLTRVCAKELGPFGIRVNAVVPGWIDTPINTSMYLADDGTPDLEMRETVLEQMAALSPLGLTGLPSDIGLAVLYLASEASRFVTGQLLRVSGGV